MIRLIRFLNEKNHFLEKFYALNEEQMTKLQAGNFEDLERFYNQREDLLKIIKYIDGEIQKSHTSFKLSGAQFSEDDKKMVRGALRDKENYAQNILEQDLKILGLIDAAKTEIIKELQGIQKTKKAMDGYKTPAA